MFYEEGTVEDLARIRQFVATPSKIEVISKKDNDGIWDILESMTSGAPKTIVVMGLVLSAANQLSGINAIIYYAKQIFEHIVTP